MWTQWLNVYSVAERGRGLVADPLPQRHGAAELGMGEQLLVLELAGVEADRAHQQLAAGLLVAVEQIGQWRATLAGDADRDPGHRETDRLLGQEHERRPPLLGGGDRGQERHGHLFRI